MAPASKWMSLVDRFEHRHYFVKIIADNGMEPQVVLSGEKTDLAKFLARIDLLDETRPPGVR